MKLKIWSIVAYTSDSFNFLILLLATPPQSQKAQAYGQPLLVSNATQTLLSLVSILSNIPSVYGVGISYILSASGSNNFSNFVSPGPQI